MSFLFSKSYIVLPLVGLCGFVIAMMWINPIIEFLKKRSLGHKDEILKLMRLMGSDIDEKRLTLILLFLSYGMGVLFFLLCWPNTVLGILFGGTMIGVGWTMPVKMVQALYDRRCNQFVDQMVDGLTIMANGIKSGSNASQAMRRVTEIMSGPIRTEFRTVLNQTEFGQSLSDALTDMAMRIPKPDVQMLVTAINILSETGGNMSETFETIVVTIRERQKLEKKIQAMTAQGMMQGMILTMVPFVLAAILFLIDPKFIAPMFSTTLGAILLFVMLILQILGGFFMYKIVKIEV